MSDAITAARERIATVAADLAEQALNGKCGPANDLPDRVAAVKTAAEAVCNVAFGPQGGAYDRRDDSNASMDYRYWADYHQTQHPGEKRTPPAGFAPGEAL